jgi:flap endonuclease-1
VGLPLRDLVSPQEVPWDQLAGRMLAVDGYNALYQFLATIRQPDGQLFTDRDGHVTSHLMGLLYRTTSLLGEGVRPVWVFDGAPPALKSGTLSSRFRAKEKAEAQWREALAAGDLEVARRKAAATSHLTREMVAEARELLDALGVPYVQAPSEGEAQAADMARRGQVWAGASEDYDSLLFAAPRLVRGLAARTRGGTTAAQIIDREELLRTLGVDGDELILIGILIGTDYNDGAAGYGPKRALKLAREHLGWEASLARVGLDPTETEPVRELFRHPQVTEVANPQFRPPSESAVRELLIERHGFSEARVEGAVRKVERGLAVRPPPPTPKGRQASLEAFGPEPS